MTADDGRVISNFVGLELCEAKTSPFTVTAARRGRSAMFDLINVIAKMMNSRKGLIGPMNIGNPVEYKIIEIGNNSQRSWRSLKIVFMPLPPTTPATPPRYFVGETGA